MLATLLVTVLGGEKQDGWDRGQSCSQFYAIVGHKDVSVTHLEHFMRALLPSIIIFLSPRRLWWRCLFVCMCRCQQTHVWTCVLCVLFYARLNFADEFPFSPCSPWLLPDEDPRDIIPHDYTQMLMAANSCKCLKVCAVSGSWIVIKCC